MFDKFHEECGVVGVFGHRAAATLAYLGLYALQHRGQESAGIVASNGEALISHRGMGHVAEIFGQEILARLRGRLAIGHNRYSTSGSTVLKNCQPFVVEWAQGALAIAHNGNLVNADELRSRLEARGSIFQSTVDSEVIIHLIAASSEATLTGRIIDALSQVKGAYSLVFLTKNRIIAARDPRGFRPLVLGRVGDALVVASETCALDLVDARYEREIEPGEIVTVSERGLDSVHPFPRQETHACVFEYIYFARPDSRVFGRNVYEVRKTTSQKLVAMIRQAGAREVHVRISAPPTTHPCFYGIDTPTRAELIASSHSAAEIRAYLGADSLAYLSVAGMYAFAGQRANFCDACFTGNYPIPPGEEVPVRQLHLFEACDR